VESKARAKGNGKGEKAPRSEVRGHLLPLFFLNTRQAKPTVQCNALRYRATSLGVDCHR
jgi:hypothetical protein